jgi:tetratricopeptide (TPR) repeat protein
MGKGIIKKIVQVTLLLLTMHIDSYAAGRLIAPPAEKATCPRVPKNDTEKNACEQLTTRYPDDADFYFNLGNFYMLKENRDLARSWFNKGVQADPSYFRTFNVLAILAGWDNDPDKEIAALDKSISINQNDPAPYMNRGVLWQDKGEYDKAIADYDEAIRLDSKFDMAYSNRCVAWKEKGDYDKAIVDCEKAIKLDPKSASAYLNRGGVWRRRGEYDKAISDYNSAIRLNKDYALAYNNRGNAWVDKGKLENAFADYNQAIKLDPKLASPYIGRGNVWQDKGNLEKALADYNEAIKLDPKQADAYNNRGNVWNKNGYYDKAIADFNKAIGLKADRAVYFNNRGSTYLNSNKLDEAISDFKEAVRLDPKYGNAKESLQLALDKKHRSEMRNSMVADQRPASSTTTGGKRIGLVIGNGSYKNVPALENPVRDAELFANSLKSAGFDSVLLKTNLSRQQMIETLHGFEEIAAAADWAIIYYAGHGMEVEGTNYMVPIDARPIDENNFSTQTVNLQFILNSVEVARKLRLVILDACRDNPFAQKVRIASASRSLSGLNSASIGRGLGRIEPDPGTLVVYAAKHGEFALDGEGQNSPFVQAVVKRINQRPPIEVRRLFDFVREDVVRETKQQQQPFAYGSLSASDDFYFSR